MLSGVMILGSGRGDDARASRAVRIALNQRMDELAPTYPKPHPVSHAMIRYVGSSVHARYFPMESSNMHPSSSCSTGCSSASIVS